MPTLTSVDSTKWSTRAEAFEKRRYRYLTVSDRKKDSMVSCGSARWQGTACTACGIWAAWQPVPCGGRE